MTEIRAKVNEWLLQFMPLSKYTFLSTLVLQDPSLASAVLHKTLDDIQKNVSENMQHIQRDNHEK